MTLFGKNYYFFISMKFGTIVVAPIVLVFRMSFGEGGGDDGWQGPLSASGRLSGLVGLPGKAGLRKGRWGICKRNA